MPTDPASPSDLETLAARARMFAGLILDHLADAREARTEEERTRHLNGIGETTARLLAAIDRAAPLGDE